MQPVDPALLDRGADQESDARRSQRLIAEAFLKAFAGQVPPTKHHQITLSVPFSLGPIYYRLCSCGFVSRPFGHAHGADMTNCPLQETQQLITAHLKSIHAERVIQTLLQLSIGR
jgi:hypothetical protein